MKKPLSSTKVEYFLRKSKYATKAVKLRSTEDEIILIFYGLNLTATSWSEREKKPTQLKKKSEKEVWKQKQITSDSSNRYSSSTSL